MVNELRWFLAGILTSAVCIILLIFAVRATGGPPNGGIDMDDMLSIASYLRDDVKSCNDTIKLLRKKMSELKVEQH